MEVKVFGWEQADKSKHCTGARREDAEGISSQRLES